MNLKIYLGHFGALGQEITWHTAKAAENDAEVTWEQVSKLHPSQAHAHPFTGPLCISSLAFQLDVEERSFHHVSDKSTKNS